MSKQAAALPTRKSKGKTNLLERSGECVTQQEHLRESQVGIRSTILDCLDVGGGVRVM